MLTPKGANVVSPLKWIFFTQLYSRAYYKYRYHVLPPQILIYLSNCNVDYSLSI